MFDCGFVMWFLCLFIDITIKIHYVKILLASIEYYTFLLVLSSMHVLMVIFRIFCEDRYMGKQNVLYIFLWIVRTSKNKYKHM